jgi:hypothetical protein
MNWALSKNDVKVTGSRRIIPHLLLAVFFVSQFAFLSHQISHLSDNTDNTCLECILTPSHITDNTIDMVVTIEIDYFSTDFSSYKPLTLQTQTYYSSRAPPLHS